MLIDIEERVDTARGYFLEGYNCTQAVVLAFGDVLGTDKDTLARFSIGFGGGVGRLREVCGTVNAMAFIAGSLADCSSQRDHHQQKADTYSLVQSLAGEFRKQNGSIICRELLGLGSGGEKSPFPQERTPDYYRSRPCVRMVESAARIIAEHLSKMPDAQK